MNLPTKEKNIKDGILLVISTFTVPVILVFLLSSTKEVGEGAKLGLVLSAGTVIPAIFPFMIVSDAVKAHIDKYGIPLRKALCRFFGIDDASLPTLVSGLICGYPSGAMGACEDMKCGRLSKGATVRLAALSSNPSPAFVIGAIGQGLMNDTKIGVLLLLAMIISIAITSHVFKEKSQETSGNDNISCHKFDFIDSVRRAGYSSLVVLSFVTVFSVISHLIKKALSSDRLFTYVIPFIEITNSANHLAAAALPNEIIYLLLGFSVGFGGICANLQSLSFISECGGVKKYFVMKLTEGVICAVLSYIGYLIFIF